MSFSLKMITGAFAACFILPALQSANLPELYFNPPPREIRIGKEMTDVVKNGKSELEIVAPKAAGGVVFIAHPTGYFRKNDLKRMDEMREVLMFDGIECAHTSIPEELTPFYREYCLKHGLLSTAGSDTHSVPGNQYRFCEHCNFACHIGDSRWKDEIFERVKVYNK